MDKEFRKIAEKAETAKDAPGAITAEQARGIVEDIVGSSIAQLKEQLTEERQVVQAEQAYIEKYTAPPMRGEKEIAADLANVIGAISFAGYDRDNAVRILKAKNASESAIRAVTTLSVSAGAALVNPQYAAEFIPYLRNKSVIMSSGPTVVDMPSGFMYFGKMSTGATAGYRGEGSAGTVGSQTYGDVTLSRKILDVIMPVSEQVLMESANGAQIIEEDLVGACSEKADATLLRSDGSVNRPRGLRYLASTSQVFNETNATTGSGNSTAAEVASDLGTAIQYLMDANIRMVNPIWFFAPRTWKYLWTAMDSNSNYIWRDELRQGTLYGYPFKETGNIPKTLTAATASGAGSDASEVYFVNMRDILIGETQGLRITSSPDASYTTGGSLVSAFERGEVLTKVQLEHDQNCRFGGQEIAVISSVTWGA